MGDAGRVSRSAFLVVLLALVGGFVASQASAAVQCKTPLPEDVNLGPPPEALSPELTRFHGMWGNGQWEGKLCHTLVVKVLNDKGVVSAVYSWGGYAGWHTNPGYVEQRGKIDGDELDLGRLGNGAEVSYEVKGDKLHGSYYRNGRLSKVVLSRLTTTDASKRAADAAQQAAAVPKVDPGQVQKLLGTWEGSYVATTASWRGQSTLEIRSIRGDIADMSIQWRWRGGSSSYDYRATVLTDGEGRIAGLEPWPNNVLKVEGDRLVGDLKLRSGRAKHTYRKE